MGDYNTLLDLIDFTKSNFPAERYIIALYDHGGGWDGACWDVTNYDDNITMDEINKALTESGGVNFVLFTAPCLMGAIESAYELRNCTDIYIGSENYSGFAWWFDSINDFVSLINNNPDISNIELAESIIDFIYQNIGRWASFDWSESLTMSAVSTDKLEQLVDSIDLLSQEYISNIDAFRSFVQSDSFNVTRFLDGVDLFQLIEQLETLNNDQEIYNLSQDVKTQIENSVIAKCNGSDFPNARGLTIYFPENTCNTLYCDMDYGLDFVENTHWGEFISLYFGDNYEMRKKFPHFKGNGFIWH